MLRSERCDFRFTQDISVSFKNIRFIIFVRYKSESIMTYISSLYFYFFKKNRYTIFVSKK